MSERLLVLVRHGQSEWNLKNLFTGWKDPDLTEKGVSEAKAGGQLLKQQGFHFDVAFTSALKRAQRTLQLFLAELGQTSLLTHKDQALNERDYGGIVLSNNAAATVIQNNFLGGYQNDNATQAAMPAAPSAVVAQATEQAPFAHVGRGLPVIESTPAEMLIQNSPGLPVPFVFGFAIGYG